MCTAKDIFLYYTYIRCKDILKKNGVNNNTNDDSCSIHVLLICT